MSQIPDPAQEWRTPPPEASEGVEASAERPAPHGSDPYGADAPYGRPGTAHAPPPAAAGTSAPPSTIVLLVVAGVLLLATAWTVVGIAWAAPVVLAAVGLARSSTNPSSTRRLTRIGWWVTAGLAVLGLLLVALLVVGIVLFDRATVPTGYDSSTVGLSTAVETVRTLHALGAASAAAAR